MFKRIDHVELITHDLEKTLDFYTKTLGFTIKQRQPMKAGSPWKEIVFLTLGDTMIEILTPIDTAREKVSYRMMALEVDNMDKTIATLKSQGIEISREPVALAQSKRAEIKDVNGLTIELRQW